MAADALTAPCPRRTKASAALLGAKRRPGPRLSPELGVTPWASPWTVESQALPEGFQPSQQPGAGRNGFPRRLFSPHSFGPSGQHTVSPPDPSHSLDPQQLRPATPDEPRKRVQVRSHPELFRAAPFRALLRRNMSRTASECRLSQFTTPPPRPACPAHGARRPRAADQEEKDQDNEERFWFGGAAHKRYRGRWVAGTAPVSQKRVGLNRQPPDGYGDSWCRPADEHARTAASRRARIGAMACSGALPTSGVASWHRPGARVPVFVSDETPCGTR